MFSGVPPSFSSTAANGGGDEIFRALPPSAGDSGLVGVAGMGVACAGAGVAWLARGAALGVVGVGGALVTGAETARPKS